MRHRSLLSTAAFLLLLSASPTAAAWQPDGIPLSSAASCCPTLAPDAAGGLYVVWTESRPDSPGVYARRLSPSGDPMPGWGASGTRVGGAGSALARPDGLGGLLVATSAAVSRWTAADGPAAGWPADGVPIGGTGNVAGWALAADGVGGAYVARAVYDCIRIYPDAPPQCFSALDLTHVGPDGTVSWSQGLFTTAGISVENPVMTEDGSGGVLVFGSMFPGGRGVYRVTSSGAQLWARSLEAYGPFLVSDGAGGAILAWALGYPTPSINAARVLEGGEIAWQNPVTYPVSTFQAAAASDGAGGLLFAWTESPGGNFLVQRISGSGSIAPGWPANGRAIAGSADWPEIVADGTGSFHAIAAIQNQLLDYRIGPSGAPDPECPDAIPIEAQPAAQYSPRAIPDGMGGIFVTWADARSGHLEPYANRVGCDNATATLVQRFEVAIAPASLEIRWRLADPNGSVTAWVETAPTERGPWTQVIGAPETSGDGTMRLRIERPLETRFYRLALREADGSLSWHGLERVDPAIGPAALTVAPNPGRLPLRIEFMATLPGSVRFEVLDPLGRRLWQRSVEATTPGVRHVVWGDGRTEHGPGPGIYFVRCRSGNDVITRRIALMP